jgi:hypothetical protein
MPRHVVVPALPLTGRCQCGAARYSIGAPPLAFYFCHCSECQKQSSSAFGQSLQVEAAAVTFTGELRQYSRPTDSGGTIDCFFCPQCGSRVYHRTPGAELLTIKGGTLDERSWLMPAGHIWTRSRQPWTSFGPDELVFEKGAPKGVLHQRWLEMTA